MDTTKSYQFLHQEHQEWLKVLNFYQDEIKFFQNQILDTVLHHLQEINMEKVGEYRLTFLNHLKVIDDFRFQILLHEQQMAKNMNEKLEGNDHSDFREEFNEFEQVFTEMKENFKQFLSKYKKVFTQK